MAEIYTKKIGIETDWNGDSSTNYLPVSGEKVQEFIKDELKSKIGAFYKPSGGNYIYGFASQEDKEKYLETNDENLIVDKVETESNYSVYLNQEELVLSKSVIDGVTGNTIEFQFKIVDRNGLVADSRANVEYSFLSAGNIKKYTAQVQVNADGWTTIVSDVIDDYLRNGENTITVSIQGLTTKAIAQFIMTYNVFNLKYETSFDYNVAQGNNSIEIPYKVSCSEIPINLEYYIDGISVSSSESMVINDYQKDGLSNIAINSLSDGKHTLQTRAYINAKDGSKFYSDLYYYSFCKQGNTAPSFLMKKVLSNNQSIATLENGLIVDIEQFSEFSFEWSLYDYLERRLTVNFEYDGSILSKQVFDTNGKIGTFSFKPLTHGNGKVLRVFALDDDNEIIFEDEITFNVNENSSGIKETMDGLLLKLSATGRRNSDADYDVWKCVGNDNNEYYATFTGFEWNKQQGWNEDYEALVISNGAYVDFNIQPMVRGWQTYGGTFEIDLETFDIKDDDAIICECKNELDNSYFKITATNAEFSTADNIKINTRYKDNEKLKIAFIGNKKGNGEDDNLIYIVVNGVLERAQLYGDNDRIYSNAFLRIGDINGKCKVRLKSIRVYNRAITVDEEFNNYVIDSPNSQIIYENNNVIKKGTTNEIGFDEVANKLPVMIFTGNMNELVTAGQDKNWRIFDVEYINRQEPERNFIAFNCQMKLQGTSSLGYPRKNFKLKTKNKMFTEESTGFYASTYSVDFDNTTEGNRRLLDKRSGKLLDFGELTTECLMYDYKGRPLKKGNYKFRADSHKASKWTLKADFMESSCSHNVGAGRSWNSIFENTELDPSDFAGYSNNTYKESALVNRNEYETYTKGDVSYKIPRNTDAIKNQKKYVCRTDAQKICLAENVDDVRTAVDGFPMVCFYRTSHEANDLVFIGQYNFINDKGSYEVFGFEDIESKDDENVMIYDASKIECWEGLKNANPISLFQTVDNWNDQETGWKSTYESRYPDPDDVTPDASALLELSKWIVSTRHENDTVYGSTINVDASFANRINGYQYGYPSDDPSGYEYFSGSGLTDNAENRQKKFETEKWEHFDVWKLAGYYIYLMRYGAVDQFVKNTMLFTDGNGLYDSRQDKKYRKWYFINYDGDCLFGLRNNGELAFHWDLDRQTTDGSSEIIRDENDDYTEDNVNTYAMMGHDSTLWNNLERDDEFMRMVMDLDNSMTRNGLNYENMVTEFDTNQTEKWCERIYNANERYKYIQAAKGLGDMNGNKVNNLWMLQGTRRSHRHWWIANHFNLLDAKWLSGKYRQTYMEIKTDCNSGATFYGIAGTDYYFAWGLQKKIYESNMVRNSGETINFTFTTNQVQGDPVYVYAVNKMSELNFSAIADKVAGGSFKFVIGDTDVANTLKKLVIGNPNVINTSNGIDTSTWEALDSLEYLDITNYKGIINVPFESFENLKTFKGFGSGLASFNPSEGSKFELVELPETITTLELNNISFINGSRFSSEFKYEPTTRLRVVNIDNNTGVDNTYYNKIIAPWISKINESANSSAYYDQSSINISHINWSFDKLSDLFIFEDFKKYCKEGNFVLKGKIVLTSNSLTMDDINKIKGIFGENCFSETMSSIYIKTPESIFIKSEHDSLPAGQTNVFSREIYPDENVLTNFDYSIFYRIVSASDVDIESEYVDYSDGNKKYLVLTDEEINNLRPFSGDGTIRVVNTRDENGKEIMKLESDERKIGHDTNLKVMACLKVGEQNKISITDYTIKDPTYASTCSITGEKSMYMDNEYVFRVNLFDSNGKRPIGTEYAEWTISFDNDVNNTKYDKYILSATRSEDTLSLYVKTTVNQPDISELITINVSVSGGSESEYGIVSSSYITLYLNENVIITSQSNPVVMNICYQNGWSENVNAMLKSEAASVTDIGTAFNGIRSDFDFNEFKFFTSISEIPENAFADSSIKSITIPKNVTRIGSYGFSGCEKLESINSESSNGIIHDNMICNLTVIEEGTFKNCKKLDSLILDDSIIEIHNYSFGGTQFENAILGQENVDEKTLILPRFVVTIEGNAFETTNWQNSNQQTNSLKRIELPLTLRLTNNFNLLYGPNYVEFLAETSDDTEPFYWSIDGCLYSKNTFIKYPSKKVIDGNAFYFEGGEVEMINSYAFYNVEYLESITLSSSITMLGEHCFEECNAYSIDMSSCVNLQTISQYTFSNCANLESVNLPPDNTIKTIAKYAFNKCQNLTELTIPNGVEELGTSYVSSSEQKVGYNFNECGFTELILPDSILYGGTKIVNGCNNIVYIKLPNKLKLQGYGPGYDNSYIKSCPELTGITIPVSSYYTDITYDVYDENDELIGTYYNESEAMAYMPENGRIDTNGTNVELNMNYSFIAYDCPKLKKYFMGEGDNGNGCFVYDDSIYGKNYETIIKVPFGKESVDIASGCTSMSERCFEYCSNLAEINIPDSVTSIGSRCFERCTSLKNIKIPNLVSSINFGMFLDCSNLESVYLTSDSCSLAPLAFDGCVKLKEIYVFSDIAPQINMDLDSPFGRDLFGAGYSGSKYNKEGTNRFYIKKGATGYDSEYWTNGVVTNTDKCGYTLEFITMKYDELLLTVYKDNELYDAENVYFSTEYGENTGNTAIKVTNGIYSMPVTKIYHGENIDIYLDCEWENDNSVLYDKIGSFSADYFSDSYNVGEISLSYGAKKTFKAGVFSSINPENDDNKEIITLSKKEYKKILSNLDYLNGMIRSFKK